MEEMRSINSSKKEIGEDRLKSSFERLNEELHPGKNKTGCSIFSSELLENFSELLTY